MPTGSGINGVNGDVWLERMQFPVSGAQQTILRGYGYDAADRLTSYLYQWTGHPPAKSQGFGDDGFGNMWQTSAENVPNLWQAGHLWV